MPVAAVVFLVLLSTGQNLLAQDSEQGNVSAFSPSKETSVESSADVLSQNAETISELNLQLVEQQQDRDAISSALEDTVTSLNQAQGTERASLAVRVFQQGQDLVNANQAITRTLLSLQDNAVDIAPIVAIEKDNLIQLNQRIVDAINTNLQQYQTATLDLDSLSDEYFLLFNEHQEYQDIALSIWQEHQQGLAKLGILSADDQKLLHINLIQRAEKLAGQIQILSKQEKLLDSAQHDSSQEQVIKVTQEKFDIVSNSLKKVIHLMHLEELDTNAYQQILISTTGTITKDVLDLDVASSLLETWYQRLLKAIDENAVDIIFKLVLLSVIISISWLLAKLVARILHNSLSRSSVQANNLMQKMVVGLASRLILFLGVLFALSQLGISLGPVLTGLGIAGFVIGFALQETLANFASGIMILIYRPYDIGDAVDVGDGVIGVVSDMNLVSTTIMTFDNQTLILPNNKIWGDVIKNITNQQQRRVDMTFYAPLDQDIDTMMALFKACIHSDSRIKSDPEPIVKITEINLNAVVFLIRPWVNTADYWEVYWDFHAAVKRHYDDAGIAFPTQQFTLKNQ
ncbi:MAG: mechanosensitive ion channel [Pseudomonadales bacterium]|nr:mechanosensitive ion channel [Pseudomonadales bacterium]